MKFFIRVGMIIFSLILILIYLSTQLKPVNAPVPDPLHNYNSTTYGTDFWAYHVNTSASNDAPPADPWTRDLEFSTSDYDAISSSNDVRATTTGGGPTLNPAQIFEIHVSESISSITQLDFYWEGYGDAGTPSFYVWNWTSGSWLLLGSHTNTASDGIVSVSKTSGFSDYVNSSGYIELTAVDTTNKPTMITTDYFYVNVTYTAGDTTPPTFSLNSTNSTYAGQAVEFSLKWNDNTALDPKGQWQAWLDNCTGSFVNVTPLTNFTSTPEWANFTAVINDTAGCTIRWFENATDNAGNSNNTGSTQPFSFTTTSAIVVSITISPALQRGILFGQVNAGTNNNMAENDTTSTTYTNCTDYWIQNDASSTSSVNFWHKASSDLTYGSNTILIGNVTHEANQTADGANVNMTVTTDGAYALTLSYAKIGGTPAPCDNVATSGKCYIAYWLDVPLGIPSGTYETDYYYCANATSGTANC